MMTKTSTFNMFDDADLVARSRSGDLDAFGELVARYQSLVCSLAYSATGSLPQSEDLAQETFVTAWKQLATLREPAKLRSWLCGISRNITHNWLRKEGRQPIRRAEPIETLADNPAPGPLPADKAVSEEEAALLWRSLEKIPETYREPLVLYYREQQSISAVAQALDLTEDAVKQRLSRGRKMLQEEMTAFVETTLTRSAPTRAFTIGVLAALPAFAVSSSAATVAAGAAKGTATAASAGALSFVTILLGPILGFAGAWFGVRASIKAARTPRERKFIVTMTKVVLAAVVLFNLLLAGYIWWVIPRFKQHPGIYAVVGIALPVFFAIFISVAAFYHQRRFQRIRFEEMVACPTAYSAAEHKGLVHEYKSKAVFLGLPLIHMRSGYIPGQKHQPARGWIALGDRAYGILFAAGGLAVGGIAFGGISLGLFAIGGLSLGVLAVGGLAVGGIALGGGAIGVMASGGFALGYTAAMGGLAIAHQFAIGGAAFAIHANDVAAREFFMSRSWMDVSQPGIQKPLGIFGWLSFLFFIPIIRQGLRKR